MDRKYLPKYEKIVHRPRILELLEIGTTYPLITMLAGPGYGKTMTALEFCRKTEHRLIWMRLLPIDNDTDRFWSRFLDAVGYELPELENALVGGSFPDTLGKFDLCLREFAGHLLSGSEVLLVLDSAENIKSGEVRNFLDSLIKAELENLCTLVISNERPNISNHMGNGKYYRIGPDELRFDLQETAQLFSYYGKQPTDPELERLIDSTDGWPLALRLIASQPSQTIRQQFDKTSCFQVISELFQFHYFAGFEIDFQFLLVRLACFDCIPLGLVQMLSGVGISEAVRSLTDIIFVSYDFTRELFYFQKLYHEFLALKQDAIGKENLHTLFTAAGDWYLQNGYYREAMECFWKIRNHERFMDAVGSAPLQKISKDRSNWVLDKLHKFPADYAGPRDMLEYYKGLLYLNAMRIQKSREIFLQLIEQYETDVLEGAQTSLLGHSYVAMIEIAFAQNSFAATEYAKKALALIPEGVGLHLRKTLASGNNEVFFLADNTPGSIGRSIRFIQDFSKHGRKLYGERGRGYSLLFIAEAHYYAGRLDDAWEHSARALYMGKDAGQYDIVINCLLLQMRILFYRGDCVRAKSVLGQIQGVVNESPSATLINMRDCAEALYYLRVNDLGKIPRWLSSNYEYIVDIPLDKGRDQLVFATCKYVSGNYLDAYSILLELGEILEEHSMWGTKVSALILMAACLNRMNQKERAIQTFWRAFDMTWQNGIITCFAEWGGITLMLLEAVDTQTAVAFDPGWVAHARKETQEYMKRETAMYRIYNSGSKTIARKTTTELTAREKEVLSYLAQGLTRDDIAGILEISIHGVKKHITNLYNKLGAINRADAVYIAMANGYINPVM